MSSMLSASAKAENARKGAEAHEKAIEKSKKRFGLFKPDWDQSARWYREAVKAYKLSDQDRLCVQVCRESAIAHEQIASYYTAAQDMEHAGTLLVKLRDSRGAADCYREASLYYRKNNSIDKAAAVLLKAAEALETTEDAESLIILSSACQIFEEEQKFTNFEPVFRKAISTAIKAKQMEEAIHFLQRENELYLRHLDTFENDLYRNLLCIIVLRFHVFDYDKAVEECESFQSVESFGRSDCGGAARALIQAYEEADPEQLDIVKKMGPFKYILNSVAQLVKKLEFDKSRMGKGKGKKSVKQFIMESEDEEEEEKKTKTAANKAGTGKAKKKPVAKEESESEDEDGGAKSDETDAVQESDDEREQKAKKPAAKKVPEKKKKKKVESESEASASEEASEESESESEAASESEEKPKKTKKKANNNKNTEEKLAKKVEELDFT